MLNKSELGNPYRGQLMLCNISKAVLVYMYLSFRDTNKTYRFVYEIVPNKKNVKKIIKYHNCINLLLIMIQNLYMLLMS